MRSYTVAPLAQVVCVVHVPNFDVSLTLSMSGLTLELWGPRNSVQCAATTSTSLNCNGGCLFGPNSVTKLTFF